MIRPRRDLDPTFSLTSNEAIVKGLREVPVEGAHSSELRRLEYTGNPSARVAELREDGFELRTENERHGKRPGFRVWLVSEPSGAASAPPNLGRPADPPGVAPEGALFDLAAEPLNPLRDAEAA